MSSQFKFASCRVAAMRLAVIAALFGVGTLTAAQDQPAPKWELFGGYSFVYPGARLHGLLPEGLVPVNSLLESNPRGAGASITYNFNRWIGLTGDVSADLSSGETGIAKRIDDAEFYNFSGGPKITFRTRRFSPFLEALVGSHRVASELFRSDYEVGFMVGGGLDLNLNRHWALRLIRADYVYSNHQFGPSSVVPATDIRGARLQSGLVLMWGGRGVVISPSAACSVQPGEVLAGETLTATAAGSNFNANREVRYSWSGSGIKPGESHATAQVDTSGLPAGSYQVTATLSNGRASGVASCNARFTVKEPRPPMISCSADPTSVPMGGNSTITSTATSPDGRVLTYRYNTSGGNISGNTSTAVLQTTGAQPGTITVTCNVADDRIQPLTASSTTTVNLQAPPPPPPDVAAIEKRLALHSVYFATAKPTLDKPDAGLLASQETTLTALASDFQIYLQSKPDARLTLEGHADPRGSVEYNQALSQRRVDRVKGFLVALGIPADNVQTKAFGEQENLTDIQVKEAVERNPELSPEDRQKVLKNMRMIILASNRRVDITLTNVGQTSQQSVREYPFNATDSLTLLQEQGNTKSTGRAHTRTRALNPK